MLVAVLTEVYMVALPPGGAMDAPNDPPTSPGPPPVPRVPSAVDMKAASAEGCTRSQSLLRSHILGTAL